MAKSQPVADPKSDGKKTVTCFECGGPHYRRDCPNAKVKKPDGGRNVTSKSVSFEDEQDEEEFSLLQMVKRKFKKKIRQT